MQRVAIIGGGISGLSISYYLSRFNSKLKIYLFEGKKVGGWINTVHKDGFTVETGPRSFRVGPKALPLLNLCDEIGIFDKILCSKTSSSQSLIYSDSKFHEIMPSPPFAALKTFFKFPVYRRFFFKNIYKKIKDNDDPDFDISLEEFFLKEFNYANEEDKNFIIYTILDAFQLGIYSGELNKLSARSCYPFSDLFKVRYLSKSKPIEDAEEFHLLSNNKKILYLYKEAKSNNASAMNFAGGMEVLPISILKYLNTLNGFELVSDNVVSIQESFPAPIVSTSSKSYEVDHVISTVPSFELKSILKDKPEITSLCEQVPYNSIQTINLGFEKLNLEGVGYLVPPKENCPISGVLFDSCSFPYLRNTVSIMGKLGNSIDDMINTFRQHTGVKEPYIYMNTSKCINALPQYNVGHHKIVEKIKEKSPSWLSVSGQSFYLSGIPNCIIRSKLLSIDLIQTKKIKQEFSK